MTDTKYGKYFLNELTLEQRNVSFGRNPATVIWTDDDVIRGSHLFWAMLMTKPNPPSFPGHGPHTHRDPEVLVMLGTNPDDPSDLGGEVELYMGPEMERHLITRSTLVYIPAGFIHCPFRVTRVDKPFFFIQSQYAPKLTEKSYKKLAAEELRDKMVFFDLDGTQTDEEIDKQRPRNAPDLK